MYQKPIFLGMDLYTILLLVGVIACMAVIRLLSDHRKMRARWFNLVLFGALIAVVLGYGAAALFQSFYDWMATGVFSFDSGTTFYGGLIGGTVTFIALYFIAGRFLFSDGYHKAHFRDVSDMAAPAITVAHGFGRLGCLMAGCCHGKPTDAWYGIPMNIPGDGTTDPVKVIPVQLFEAIFLLAFSAVLFVAFWKGKRYLLPAYMVGYGLWRFPAEMMRADDRGATIVDFLTPSQLISILLIAGGVALLAVEITMDRRAAKHAEAVPAEPTMPPSEGTEEIMHDDA